MTAPFISRGPIEWDEDRNVGSYSDRDGNVTEWGEWSLISRQENWGGGQYRVIHLDDTGDFLLLIEGGHYLDPWEHEIGVYSSPLAAIREAQKQYTLARAQGRAEEAIIDAGLKAAEDVVRI